MPAAANRLPEASDANAVIGEPSDVLPTGVSCVPENHKFVEQKGAGNPGEIEPTGFELVGFELVGFELLTPDDGICEQSVGTA